MIDGGDRTPDVIDGYPTVTGVRDALPAPAHAAFRTTYGELVRMTGGAPAAVFGG